MRPLLRAHVFIDEDSMRTLEHVRRGTRQPLSRLLTVIVRDYVDGLRDAHRARARQLRDERRSIV
jgi:hypothetical protein